jgi:hypothetical protein
MYEDHPECERKSQKIEAGTKAFVGPNDLTD